MNPGNYNLKAKIYKGKTGLDEIFSGWKSINEQNENSDLSHLPEWYVSIFDSFKNSDQDFRFVVIYRDNQIEMILPVKKAVKKINGIKLKSLELPFTGHFVFRDLVTRSDEVKPYLFEYLWKFITESDELKFDIFIGFNIHRNSNFFQFIKSSKLKTKFLKEESSIDFIILNKYENIHSAVSGNFRHNLKKNKKKISKKGDLIFEGAISRRAVNSLFGRFVDLEASGWKGKNGTSTAIKCRPELMEFYKNMMINCNGSSEFDIQIASINNTDVAGQLGIRYKNTFYTLKIGYNEHYSKFGPGNLLQEYVISRFREDGKTDFINLMSGFKWHKLWTKDYVQTYNAVVFQNSIKGMFVYFLQLSKNYAKKLLM